MVKKAQLTSPINIAGHNDCCRALENVDIDMLNGYFHTLSLYAKVFGKFSEPLLFP